MSRIIFKTDIAERYKKGESSHKISKSEGCSYNTVLRELKRRGIDTGIKFWTIKQIEKLKEVYSFSLWEELLKEFPTKNKKTIAGMARKLGLNKDEYKKICKDCGKKFIVKFNYKRKFCPICLKKQWAKNNRKNAMERQERWLKRNPDYLKQYARRPEVKKHIYDYLKRLRQENPKYRLDCSMGVAIYLSLKGKKGGRRWETLVEYTLKDLAEHLETQFDENMTWKNYGSYWQVDHIRPRSLFKYTVPEDVEFKKCWSLENLQPLEKIANLRKSNTFIT